MDEQPFFTGAFASPIDYRDVGLGQISPVRIYPKEFMIPVENLGIYHQHKLGACIGHAHAQYKKRLDFVDTGKVFDYSPRFIYALAKSIDGYSDEGTYPRVAAKILKNYGVCTQAMLPNDTLLSHKDYIDLSKITPEAYKEAEAGKIAGYAFIDLTLDGLKQAIVDFNGGSLLLSLGKEWWTDDNGRTSWMPTDIIPLAHPKVKVSGHQVYLRGYKDVEGDTIFYIVNSWGDEWGIEGTGWFYWSDYKDYLIEGLTFTDVPNHILNEVKQLPVKFTHRFDYDLKYGMLNNDEVRWLQRALKFFGVYNASITGNYWDITRDSVVKFQEKYKVPLTVVEKLGINKGKYFGPKTRQFMNELIARG